MPLEFADAENGEKEEGSDRRDDVDGEKRRPPCCLLRARRVEDQHETKS